MEIYGSYGYTNVRHKLTEHLRIQDLLTWL